jgi:GT2 family glycosyltransferase
MRLPAVIIPVFNALEYLEACIESVFRTIPADTPVWLIDDASTDPGVRPFLQSRVKHLRPQTHLVFQDQNLGFVATANHGMRLAQGDLVLLNSDTEVTHGWLQRLAACLNTDDLIATATPWSNNGEIVSIPNFCVSNPAPGNADEIARVIAASGPPLYPSLPTAVGFCMAISSRAIDSLGLFDEETFGRGYGEENDFCQRAEKAGFKNVLCDDAYVVHHGGASFAPLNLRPDEQSMQRLLGKHPDYLEKVSRFIKDDPIADRRRQVLQKLRSSGLPGWADR